MSPTGRKGGVKSASSRLSAAVRERDVLTGVSMAFVGGFVDAAGFMALAGLFTSHVTGNFVLIGEQLATGTGGVIAKLVALPIFVLSVGSARLVALAMERRKIAPMRPLLLMEALLLSAFLLAGMVLSPLRLPDSIEAIFTGMFAVTAMGVQNAIGRLSIAHLATTTVMTVNVAQATIDALDIWLGTAADQGKPARARLWRMAPAIGSFAVGALAGAFGFALFAFACVAVPIVALLALFALLGTQAAGNMPG
ncbi:YoaK family protein [Ancylobacter pratisalsi]|uniref:DUF1275 domain-containing protein n=1 Tax=Ancylobacter pratisalsi TaxID=1745854 RepID=A0A6P1YMK0_9HYPH|nr:DUF1275 domain-containing protein [Ancylobacter pratisalsi]